MQVALVEPFIYGLLHYIYGWAELMVDFRRFDDRADLFLRSLNQIPEFE